MTLQFSIALLFVADLAFASGAPIGVAKSGREFRLDKVPVRSNTTVFDGSTVESGVARSEVKLMNGTQLLLGANSRSRVYSDRVVLEHGVTEIEGAGKYRVEALSLKVTPDSPTAVALVSLSQPERVLVAARSGPLNVTTASGVLVARVLPGAALEFDPNAASGARITKVSGLLQKKAGKLFLKDSTTNVVFEVRGTELEQYAGKKVVVTGTTVSGSTPSSDASQVLNVTQMTLSGTGTSTGATAARGGAAPAGTVAGLSTRAFVAVVGGVAAAASVGGLVATGAIGGDEPSVSRP